MKKLTMNECSKRKLDEMFIVIYAIKNEVNIKKGEYIEKAVIYTFVGIDNKGYRQLINVYQDRINNNRYWLDVFESLKGRGLKELLFLSVDNNKNMKRAAKIAF
ncbi:MAG: transposase, partial [Bacilli bacterium]|nr:transposase [Bacilli bacterium]